MDQTYVIPRENNPIEMHATIAAWDGDRLTLWDKTQWVHNVADEIAALFGISPESIRVVSPFDVVAASFAVTPQPGGHVSFVMIVTATAALKRRGQRRSRGTK